MTKKIFMALSMIVVFAVSGSTVYAYNGGHGGGNGGRHGGGCGGGRGHNGSYDRNDNNNRNDGYGHRNGRNSSYYNNMTVEEKAKYDALSQEYTPKMDILRDKMIDQKTIINSEYSKTTPNLDTINSAIDERSKLSAEMSKLRAAYSIEMQKLFPDNNSKNYRRLTN